MNEHECVDVATGASVQPCIARKVLLSATELAQALVRQMAVHGATVVFLASNAKDAEVRALQAALGRTPIVRFDAAAVKAALAASEGDADDLGLPELAVMDTLICALSDVFLGTRRSMFTWNILEERILQRLEPTTGMLM